MAQRQSSRRFYADYRQRKRRGEPPADGPKSRAEAMPRQRGTLTLLRDFFGLLGEHKLTVVASLAALGLSTLIGLAPLYAPKIVIDNVLGDEPLPGWVGAWVPGGDSPRTLLVGLIAVSLLLTVVSVAIGLWSRWHATRVSKRMQSEVRRDAFEHAANLPLHRVYDLKIGGIAGLLRDDAGAVGNLVFGMLYNPWKAAVQFVGTLVVLTLVDWKLLIGGLCVLPITWLTHRTWIGRIRPMFRDVRRTRRRIDGQATETFGGMRVVRAFGRQRSEAGSFVTQNHVMIRQELHAWWWMRGVDTAWAILIPLASAGLLLYGGWRILSDRSAIAAGELAAEQALTVGDLVVFLSYLAALLGPVATLAATATTLQNDLAALDRTLELLNEEREMPVTPGTIEVSPASVDGRITFDRVAFRYPKSDSPVLEDISIDALPGQTIALVGPSGAGKTTLCNLVARFYDPTSGSVRLDGRDLRDIDVRTYRTLLGVVEQDVFLFDGSVAENIGYARRDAPREAIIQAAKQANAHGFICDMEDGYETLIGERGVKLSGGQRQRLAIARGAARRPAAAHPRRGDEQPRHREREADPVEPPQPDEGPHQLRHRPPAEHDHARGPDPRVEQGPHR